MPKRAPGAAYKPSSTQVSTGGDDSRKLSTVKTTEIRVVDTSRMLPVFNASSRFVSRTPPANNFSALKLNR